jgi:hypothetical protein
VLGIIENKLTTMTETNKNLIKGFGLTIFAIITGFASIIGLPDSKGNLKMFLLIIAIISLIVSFYFFLSSKIRFSSGYNLLIKSKELGILKIHSTGISDDALTNRIRNSKIIKMFFATGIAFFRTREDDLIKAFENNANILILLTNPNSDFTKEIEHIESRNQGEIGHEIEQVKTILNRCLNEAKKNTNNNSNGKFSIKYFNSQLRFPMVICDEKYAWITLTLPPARSVQSISFEAIKSEKGLLNNCMRHFDEIWASIDNEKESQLNQNDLIDFLVGDWKNEWIVNKINNTVGVELFQITKDYKYLINGDHLFNIDSLQFDKNNGKITFIKSGVKPNDNRKLLNELKKINNNKLEGIESDYDIRYYRI